MPRQRQPRTLLALSVEAVAKRIVAEGTNFYKGFPAGTMPANLEVLRREYVSSLPVGVRALLLEEVNRLLSLPTPPFTTVIIPPEMSGVLSIYASVFLLTPDIERICVRLCCSGSCCHQKALLVLLAKEGAGLRSLEFTPLAFPKLEPALLQQALIRPVSLNYLYFPKVCTDAHLQIISSTCPNLSLLDVSGSRYVTDVGLDHLVFRKKVPFMEGVASPGVAHLCIDPSCDNSDCTLIRLLFKLFPMRQSSRDEASLRLALRHWKYETQLCGTLRVLDIGYTNVTQSGILLALMKLPLLRTLGMCSELGDAVEIFHLFWSGEYQNSLADFPKFGLHVAHIAKATESLLAKFAMYFPNLTDVWLTFPYGPALMSLPPEISALHVHKVNYIGFWLPEVFLFLNKPQGRNLQYLSLNISSMEGPEVLNLYELFQSCPNLRTFNGEGMEIQWVEGRRRKNVSMPHLRELKVGKVVASKAVVEVLKRCPNLQVAHFLRCTDLTDADMVEATDLSPKHLKCFYVFEAPRLTAQTFFIMQSACENLSRIGDVIDWSIVLQELLNIKRIILENNWDLEVTDARHWLTSTCKA